MTTALVYIRQSRHKDYERTASPEVQWQACGKLPSVKACEHVEKFEDLDASGGKTAGRKRYHAFLERIKQAHEGGDVAVVALYDQSRGFRNTADALAFYAVLEQRPWIDVQFAHGRFDRSPAGEFSYTAMAAAHSMERRMTAEKIREAYAYRNARGEATGPAPAGYRREGAALVIDEQTSQLITRIFKEYATGSWSTRALAHRLNAEGAILPASKGWYGDTIAQVLGNVAYIGKTYTKSRLRKQGALITATWPALIETTLWEAAQRQLKRRAHGGGPASKREYVFRGLLKCGLCGRPLHVKSDRPRVYYRCRGEDAPDTCPAPFVREDALLPWAEDLFRRLDGYQPDGFAEAVALHDHAQSSPDALAQVDLTLDRLGKRFMWGHIEETEYLRERERLEGVKAELAAAQAPVSTIKLEGIHDAWLKAGPAGRRRLLGDLFDALQVTANDVTGYTPRQDRAAEVIALLEQVWQLRRERDSNPRRLAP